jgi:predicted amidophosphoribosyltransferase
MLSTPRCVGCGAVGVALCSTCVDGLQPAPLVPPPPGVDAVASVFSYEGIGRRLVLGLKYRNRRADLGALAGSLAAALAEVEPWLEHRPAVTWAPTTARRRRRRGFDQARWLAAGLGRATGLPVRRTLVRRPSPPQTGAPRADRWRHPAFVASRPRASPWRSIVVVDDVATSGATLAAAAAALHAVGSENVVAVTLAQTPLNCADRPAETV